MIPLILTAASIGFLHTLLGPDHYLPFVMIAQARKWSRVRTAWITFLCGVGHVAGSVVLGAVGIAAGMAVGAIEGAESIRGDIAAWLLMAMGLVYMSWGLRQAWRSRPHTHGHFHLAEDEHQHQHSHDTDHAHLHEAAPGKPRKKSITPWVLFLIFVFGPCEPLIPILMYPAARKSIWGVAAVTAVFALATIATMLTVVLAATFGLRRLPTARLERYSHALAGAIILLCGVSIRFLGL